eukprot:7955638-Pyramimonas_sp.AAC.1
MPLHLSVPSGQMFQESVAFLTTEASGSAQGGVVVALQRADAPGTPVHLQGAADFEACDPRLRRRNRGTD